jgi:hypothetical protein
MVVGETLLASKSLRARLSWLRCRMAGAVRCMFSLRLRSWTGDRLEAVLDLLLDHVRGI